MRLLLAALLFAPSSLEQPALELVETAPVETTLDDPDLRETDVVWLEMIGAAETSLDLAHFYASNREGSRLEPVIRALEAAADRGVRVRFLASETFYGLYPETLDRLDARERIDVRRLDLQPVTGGVLHAKYLVADGKELFVGSPNFDWRSLEHVQELGLRLRSVPVARAYGEVFRMDWRLAAGIPLAKLPAARSDASQFPVALPDGSGGTVRVTPVFSPLDLLPRGDGWAELWDLPRMVSWIDEAQREVRVQVLTYKAGDRDGSYWDELESALRRAAARGVSVRLLVADWGKRSGTIEGLKSLQALKGIEVRMTTIPAASEGHIPYARVAHAKQMIVDGRRVWMGTSNWSRDYFYASRNAGLLLESENLAARIQGVFDRVWASEYAYVVDLATEYEVPRIGD